MVSIANMPGARGQGEDQMAKIAALEKASESLTKSNVYSVLLVFHPKNGLETSGESESCKFVEDLLEKGGVEDFVKGEQGRNRNSKMINFTSTVRRKGQMLQKIHKSILPPLTAPLSEMNNSALLQTQFAKVLQVETAGLNIKEGEPLPDSIKEWFTDEDDIFHCLRGVTYKKELVGKLKDKGMGLKDLYLKMIKSVYTVRLGGEEHLESYHLQRDIKELNQILQEREGLMAVEGVVPVVAEVEARRVEERRVEERRLEERRLEACRAEERRAEELGAGMEATFEQFDQDMDSEEEDEMQRKLDDERMFHQQKNKEREQKRKREEKEEAERERKREKENEEKRRKEEFNADENEINEYLKTKVSNGVFKDIHMSGKTESEKIIVQVVDMKIVENKVVSATLNDGTFVTTNVKPRGDKEAAEMMKLEKFEVINVQKASVEKDTIILDKIAVIEMKDKNDADIKIKKLIKADGVDKLKLLKKELLTLWGLKFPNRKEVELNIKETEEDPNASILLADSALSKVGRKSVVGHMDSISQPDSRSRRETVKCPMCVRTFLAKDSLANHLHRDH